MAHDGPDAHESDLLGFAATLTDDPALMRHLVGQAMAHVADEPSTGDPAAAARVWTVRGLLSDGYLLGAPVAPDVDTAPDVENGAGDDLGARLARSSRLQRAVVALYYGRHSDAITVVRIVGSTESDIKAYLGGVRIRLGIDLDRTANADGEQSLRRLLQDLHTAEVERMSATQHAERARSAADLQRSYRAQVERTEHLSEQLDEQRQAAAAELTRLDAEERLAETARTDALIVGLQRRLDAAIADHEDLAHERDLAAARETAATSQIQNLHARVDEYAEQERRRADERLAETAQTDGLIVDLQRRLETATADHVAALDRQRQNGIAELAHQRDLAAARETAADISIQNLQARVDEHAEQARRRADERPAEIARTDAVVAELRSRLDSARTEDHAGDRDVEPVLPTDLAEFEAAPPIVFTAIGPVRVYDAGVADV